MREGGLKEASSGERIRTQGRRGKDGEKRKGKKNWKSDNTKSAIETDRDGIREAAIESDACLSCIRRFVLNVARDSGW